MKFLLIHAALAELTYWYPCPKFLSMLDLPGPFEKIRSDRLLRRPLAHLAHQGAPARLPSEAAWGHVLGSSRETNPSSSWSKITNHDAPPKHWTRPSSRRLSSCSLIGVLGPRLGQRNAEQCSVAVLHCLLTNVTVFEDWFTVLNRLLAIEVWFVSMVAESVLRHLIRAASPLRT